MSAGVDWEELDREAEKRRRRIRKLSEAELRRTLTNADGLQKLADISDEEWAAAERADAEAGNAA